MRIWKCDKCGKEFEGQAMPKGIYHVMIYTQAKSKGGKGKGCELCSICGANFLNAIPKWEREIINEQNI